MREGQHSGHVAVQAGPDVGGVRVGNRRYGVQPAVYDIDVLPEYLAIQGDQADAEIMARLENLLPGETAVIIKREVVEEALRKLLAEGGTS
jgi:hypothetical protein